MCGESPRGYEPQPMKHALPEPVTGSLRNGVHYYPVRVYFEDTDLSGFTYHANYLRWFERARSDLLDVIGVDQRQAMESGEGHYAVADLAIRYLAPARLGDAVLVETRSRRIGKASIELAQRALRGDSLLAEMDVRVGFVGTDGRPRRQPDPWLRAFATINPQSAN